MRLEELNGPQLQALEQWPRLKSALNGYPMRQNKLLPNFFAGSAVWVGIMNDVITSLAELDPSVDTSGFGCVSGVSGYQLINAEYKTTRRHAGLQEDFDLNEEQRTRLHNLVWKVYPFEAIPKYEVRKESSSGFPYFATGKEKMGLYAQRVMAVSEGADPHLHYRGQFIRVSSRASPDKEGKIRKGVSHKGFSQFSNVIFPDALVDGRPLCCMRARPVCDHAAESQVIFGIAAKRFAGMMSTGVHRSLDIPRFATDSRTKGWVDAFKVDCTQFDSSIPNKIVTAVWKEYLQDTILDAEFMSFLDTIPMVCKKGAQIPGKILQDGKDGVPVLRGHTSGKQATSPTNSLISRVLIVEEMLIANGFDMDVENQLRLTNQEPLLHRSGNLIGIYAMIVADDILILLDKEGLKYKSKLVDAMQNNHYFKCEEEAPSQSGKLIEPGPDGYLVAYDNPRSFYRNLLNGERAIDTRLTKYKASLGLLNRKHDFANLKNKELHFSLLDTIIKRHLGRSIEEIGLREWNLLDREEQDQWRETANGDISFLLDPLKIYYRTYGGDLETLYQRLDVNFLAPKLVAKLLKRICNGRKN